MIDSIVFFGNNGQTIVLNDDTYPLQLFDSTVETVTDERARPSQHGLYNTYTFMGKRIVHMEGDIFAADSFDLLLKRQHLIGPFIPTPELGNRSVGYLEVKYTGLQEIVSCECYLDGLPQAPIEGLSPSRGTFAITLQAFDPTLYGTTPLSAQTGAPGGGSGGVSFPITFPVTFAAGAGGAGDVLLTNGGNAAVFPTVVISGPCKDPSITIHQGDNDYTLGFTGIILDANATLTIDFKNRTVISNTLGSAYSYVVPGSTWWQIPPGTWTISFRAFSAASGCNATINYANAYML